MDSCTVAGVSTRVKDCVTTWLRIDIIVIPVVIQSVQVALGFFEGFGLRLASSKQHCSANPTVYFLLLLGLTEMWTAISCWFIVPSYFSGDPVINRPANFRRFMSRFGRLIISVAGARNRGWDDWQGDEAPEELPPVQAPKRRWGKEEAGHQKGEGSSNSLSKITKLPKATPTIKKCKSVEILNDHRKWGCICWRFRDSIPFSGEVLLEYFGLGSSVLNSQCAF